VDVVIPPLNVAQGRNLASEPGESRESSLNSLATGRARFQALVGNGNEGSACGEEKKLRDV
jgi:hypothetical protein